MKDGLGYGEEDPTLLCHLCFEKTRHLRQLNKLAGMGPAQKHRSLKSQTSGFKPRTEARTAQKF